MRWPPDRQKLLANLSALGLSAGDIARLTGESKSAVASAMWRNGLFARNKRINGRRLEKEETIWQFQLKD